jgi:hypothetical protein
MDELSEDLARALAAPGVARFAESGERLEAIALAGRILETLEGGATSRYARAQRLLAVWAERLDESAGQATTSADAYREVAGTAVAVSLIAGVTDAGREPDAEDVSRVDGAMLSHGVGVVHRAGEDGGELFADPERALRADWTIASDLVDEMPDARGPGGPPEQRGEDWLWLELEEAAARGAATAVILAIEAG